MAGEAAGKLQCRLVEDSDLYRHALPDTRAFRAGLSAMHLDMDAEKNPGIFNTLLYLDLASLLKTGRSVHVQQQMEVASAVQSAFVVYLGGKGSPWGRCLAVEGGQFSRLRSEIGNRLASRSKEKGMRGIGLVAYLDPNCRPSVIKLSLRSIDEEDTTAITVSFGGGGHRGASSCCIDLEMFLQWKA